MDGQTDRFAISISRVSMLTRDKNQDENMEDQRAERVCCRGNMRDCVQCVPKKM